MPLGRSVPLTDPDDLRFRVASVRLGALMSLVVSVTGAVNYLDGGHAGLYRLCMVAALCSALMLVLPWQGVVEGRWRDTFFAAWSGISIFLVAFCMYEEGGGRVPAAFGLALPLAFAGLMYPLRGAIAVSALAIGAFLLASMANPFEWAELLFSAASLGCLAGLCVWAAWWQARQRAKLAELSRTDPLTGCLNRRGIEAEMARALRDRGAFALLTLDLDDFKVVNDRQGHAAGDAVLCATVRALRDAVRPTDSIGRLGGDEFAVLLPGATPEVAARVLERATLALSTTAPASFGLAAHPRDGITLDALLDHADAGVYRNKAERKQSATAGRAPARP